MQKSTRLVLRGTDAPIPADRNPEASISLELTDRITDIVNENIDVAVRIGTLDDSSLVGVHPAGNRRVVVASPAYRAAGDAHSPLL